MGRFTLQYITVLVMLILFIKNTQHKVPVYGCKQLLTKYSATSFPCHFFIHVHYSIDLNGSSFLQWSNLLPDRDTSRYDVTTGDCLVPLNFESDNINDIKFNVSGTDDLVWASKNADTFCGSHGWGQDGRGDIDAFTIEWKTGKGWFAPEMEIKEIPDTSSAFLKLVSG